MSIKMISSCSKEVYTKQTIYSSRSSGRSCGGEKGRAQCSK